MLPTHNKLRFAGVVGSETKLFPLGDLRLDEIKNPPAIFLDDEGKGEGR